MCVLLFERQDYAIISIVIKSDLTDEVSQDFAAYDGTRGAGARACVCGGWACAGAEVALRLVSASTVHSGTALLMCCFVRAGTWALPWMTWRLPTLSTTSG